MGCDTNDTIPIKDFGDTCEVSHVTMYVNDNEAASDMFRGANEFLKALFFFFGNGLVVGVFTSIIGGSLVTTSICGIIISHTRWRKRLS